MHKCNDDYIVFCSQDPTDYLLGNWAGNCSNPKLLWEKLVTPLKEIGVKNLLIYINAAPIDPSGLRIDSTASISHGLCFHLDLFRQDTTQIIIETTEDITVHVHSPQLRKKHGNQLSYKINNGTTRTSTIELEVFHVLDYLGQPCCKDDNENYDTCVAKEVDKFILKEYGCTSPFGLNLDNICKDPNIGLNYISQDMMDFENVKYPHHNCSHPCTYMKVKSIESHIDLDGSSNMLYLNFQGAVTVMRSQYSYNMLSMIAEIGGYVGLFLGYSVLQISGLLELAIFKSKKVVCNRRIK